MSPDWIHDAREELVAMRGPAAAWGYHRRGAYAVEPTALACLALRATTIDGRNPDVIATGRQAAEWMLAIQQSDGSLPVGPGLKSPGWSTPYALLLWSALTGHEAARLRARQWLLTDRSGARPVREDDGKILGHDPTIAGWPWVEGTHSWIEPTSMAILALCRDGQGRHPRVSEGVRLILDRGLDRGGWNCGNKRVFGRELRPSPGPTGMALLALAARGDRSAVAFRAVDYLLATLPTVQAPVSLSWGLLALRAYHVYPRQADHWLDQSFGRCRGKPPSTMSLALLLLASAADERCLICQPIMEGSSS